MNKKQTIYMVGVGGMGMAPLAVYLSKIDGVCRPMTRRVDEACRW